MKISVNYEESFEDLERVPFAVALWKVQGWRLSVEIEYYTAKLKSGCLHERKSSQTSAASKLLPSPVISLLNLVTQGGAKVTLHLIYLKF